MMTIRHPSGNPAHRPATRRLPDDADTLAPDGAEVRILCSLAGGSAAHFRLAPGAVSRAGRHRTVEEIWYIVEGEGEMWRRTGAHEEIVTLTPGLCLTIPLGTSFQFRAGHDTALSAFAVTMPPWPQDSTNEWTPVEPRWPAR